MKIEPTKLTKYGFTIGSGPALHVVRLFGRDWDYCGVMVGNLHQHLIIQGSPKGRKLNVQIHDEPMPEYFRNLEEVTDPHLYGYTNYPDGLKTV